MSSQTDSGPGCGAASASVRTAAISSTAAESTRPIAASSATLQASSAGAVPRNRVDSLPAAPLDRVGARRRERGVALPAHRLALHERRPLPGPARDRHLRLPPPRTAITSLPSTIACRHPEPTGAVGDVGRRLALRRRHRDRPAVVLAHEDERHLPQLSHVQRLEELALARRTVAEEARDDLPGLADACRRARHRQQCGMCPATIAFVDDQAAPRVGEMHRAALSLAYPGARAISSVMTPTGSTPSAIASPWPR